MCADAGETAQPPPDKPKSSHDEACDGIASSMTALLSEKWHLGYDLFSVVRPGKALIGTYKPDFLWYVNGPSEQLALVGEYESSNYAEKDIPGACLLADNLVARATSVEKPLLAFVVPDNIKDGQMSHVEERLNIAVSRMRTIRILPAMRRADFLEWFERWAMPLVRDLNARDAGDWV